MRMAIDGLILREKETGENDKLLLALTAAQGKIWVCAKGGRSIKSNKSAVCRAFTYGELELYEKNGRLWLSGGSPSNTFFAYRTDLDGYALASYIAELCEEITGEGEEAGEVLRATLNCFYAIEKKLYPLEQIKAAYEFFAATVSGFCPDLSACNICKCDPAKSENGLWLDVMNGGVVCAECMAKHNGSHGENELDRYQTRNILLPLDTSSLMALRYCAAAPVQRLFNFSIGSKESMSLFCRATESYVLNHLERSFETLKFYNTVKD